MIRFKTLSIKNFLSYGEAPTVINLDDVGTTLIVGEDLDNTASGTGANGVGKTVWINALIYALYGKPISKISMDNLINNINKKNMEVAVEFEKNGELITVMRGRKITGVGNLSKIYIRPAGTDLNLDSTEQDKTPANPKEFDNFIVEKLGIPYELFVRIVAFAATHTPFLELPVRAASGANQSDIMEELFRLTQLSVKAEGLKEAIKDTKQRLEIKIKHNEQLEKEHNRHNIQLESARARVNDWEETRNDDIEKIKVELTKFENVPIKEQESLYKRIDKVKTELLKVKEEQKEVESVVTKISTEYTIATTNIKRFKEEKEKIVNWKDENIKKAAAYKEAAERLPEAYVLSKQKELHDGLTVLTEELDELNSKKADLEYFIKDTNKITEKLQEELQHLEEAKCPYCLQKYESKDKIKDAQHTIKNKKQEEVDATLLLDVVIKNISGTKNNIDMISEEIKYTVKEIENYERERVEYAKKMEELLNEKCPYGDKHGTGDLIDAIHILEKEAEELKERLDEEADRLVEVDEIVSALEKEVLQCKNAITISSIDELYQIKNKIIQLKDKIKELEDSVNPYLEPLKELEMIELEPIDMDSINELDNLMKHQNYLLKLLTKKDSFIRKTLLNRNLSFLNHRLKEYLIALGLPHKVEFTHEMTAHISQFGRELDFGNLSSGQKARVNLALSFSFRDVLQKSHDSINVCMLDEVLDVGLDSVGVQNAARMLKRKARDEDLALFIISHRDEVSNIFDKKMVVQMTKGFSSVKEEE